MENFTTFQRYGRTVACYFTINQETKDFENIRVVDRLGGTVPLEPSDIETLKDLLAEDIVFATIQFKSMIAAGALAHA
jgi:hypothetical protein